MSNVQFLEIKRDALRLWVTLCDDASSDISSHAAKLFLVINRAQYPSADPDTSLRHKMMALQAIDMIVEDNGPRGDEPNKIPSHLVDAYTHAMLKRRMYK